MCSFMRLHIVFSVAFFRYVVRVAGSQAIVRPTESGPTGVLPQVLSDKADQRIIIRQPHKHPTQSHYGGTSRAECSFNCAVKAQ
jgi:hypothetical protein